VGILNEGADRIYELRGDALTDYDPPLPRELLGRVTSLERRGVSLKPKSAGGTLYRAMCVMIRRSRFVTPLLLRLHAMRERDFLKTPRRGAARYKQKWSARDAVGNFPR
jgi:hypothetical protein